jgi:4-hydroxybutyrate dehydrogenase
MVANDYPIMILGELELLNSNERKDGFMKQIIFKPELHKYSTCVEFIQDFSLGKGDLIIASESSYKNYFGEYVTDADVFYPRNYGSGEPTDQMVEALYADIKKTGPHKRIIAMGGGTVLDIAKLFALRDMHPVTDLFDRKIPLIKDKELILIPTTCGTGSEVTNISILAFIQRGSKMGLADEQLFADYAVLIPELLDNLPFHFFATSSIDALIHAVESALSPKATSYTKMFSYKAIEMIIKGYQKIVENGKESLKLYMEDFLIASNYAGLAFGTAGCAAVHATSYPLSGTFHVAHGEANYAMFTGVLKNYGKKKTDGALNELNLFLSNLLSCDIVDVNEEIENLLNHILPKKSLSEYGATEEIIKEWSESVMKNQTRLLSNNFVPLTQEEIYIIYKELL